MKTTYQYKKSKENSEVGLNNEESLPNSALVDMYLFLKKVSDRVNSKVIKDVSVGAEEAIVESYSEALKKTEDKPSRKSSKLLVVLCAVLFLAIIGVLVYVYVRDANEKKMVAERNALLEEYDYFVDSMESLYSELETLGSVNTDSYRSALYEYEERGLDISKAMSELDTVDLYLADLQKVKSLSSPEVNLVSSEYVRVLDEVERSADYYSVASLRVSIKDLIEVAESEVDSYKSLRDKMLSDTAFDIANYQVSIDSIVWGIQRDELWGIASVKSAELALNRATSYYNEVNVSVENEDVPNKQLKKDEIEQRDIAIEARNLAVAEATKGIEEAKLALHEAYCNLYTIQDTMNGTTLLNEYLTKWSEENATVNTLEEQIIQ